MTVLVTGVDRVEAGKTTFSTGLVAHTGAVGFKPRAGNDYWYHHDDYLKSVESGRLYGKDARRLAAASPGTLAPEDINAIHRLWRPSPGKGTGLLGQKDRSFAVDRAGDKFVCNGTVDIPPEVTEQLSLDDAVVVRSLDELNRAMEQCHLAALEGLRQRIETTERAVVESYSDVARPIQGLDPAAVAVVEPQRVRLYDGPRYRKSCSIATGGSSPLEGQLEERVSDVVELIDPEATIELPPLASDERKDPDAVAAAYKPAYEAVFDMAAWELRQNRRT